MTIDDKLNLFRSSGLDQTISANAAKLEEIGITNLRFLKNCFFEKSVNVSSSVISNRLTTFIGAYSYINDGGYLRSEVFVGRYCSIGRRVSIGAGSHPMAGLSTHPSLIYGRGNPYSDSEIGALGIKKSAPNLTVIENDVWIGDGAVIVKGVILSTGCVVGANSVVTKNVPPYAIVGGVPARLIRYRFPAEVISELLSHQWWEYSHETLKDFPLINIFEFIKAIKLHRANGTTDFEKFDTFRLA